MVTDAQFDAIGAVVGRICAVCGKLVRLEAIRDEITRTSELRFHCHGMVQRLEISDSMALWPRRLLKFRPFAQGGPGIISEEVLSVRNVRELPMIPAPTLKSEELRDETGQVVAKVIWDEAPQIETQGKPTLAEILDILIPPSYSPEDATMFDPPAPKTEHPCTLPERKPRIIELED